MTQVKLLIDRNHHNLLWLRSRSSKKIFFSWCFIWYFFLLSLWNPQLYVTSTYINSTFHLYLSYIFFVWWVVLWFFVFTALIVVVHTHSIPVVGGIAFVVIERNEAHQYTEPVVRLEWDVCVYFSFKVRQTNTNSLSLALSLSIISVPIGQGTVTVCTM